MANQVPSLPLSAPCVYYPRGQRSRARAAIVNRSDPQGILGLSLFAPDSRVVEHVEARYCGDPIFKSRPDLLEQMGTWDYAEWFPQPCDPKAEPKQDRVAFSSQDVDELLVSLLERNGLGQATKIAEEMAQITGEQWTYQKVNANLRRLGKMD